MKAAGTVDQIIVQAIELVTGDNEEFFARAGAIEQTQHRILRIFIVPGLEGLIKLVKQDHNFLIDGFNEIGDTADIAVSQNDRIALFDGLDCNHLSGQRFTDAFIAAEDDTQVAVERFERIQHFGNLATLDTIHLFVDDHIRAAGQIETGHLRTVDIIGTRRDLVIRLHIVAIQEQITCAFNNFHF